MSSKRKAAGLLGLFVALEILTRVLAIKSVPPASEWFATLFRLIVTGEILPGAKDSIVNLVVGFLVAAFFGVTVGVLISTLPVFGQVAMPVVDIMRLTGAVAILPLVTVIFGIGMEGKVVLIFWTSWPAILLSTITGMNEVDGEIVEAARLDGASEWQVIRRIKLPLAFPSVATGLKIGLAAGWASVVAAEMIGASRGLGLSTLLYSQTFRFAETYATVVAIALSGFIAVSILSFLTDKLYIERILRSEK